MPEKHLFVNSSHYRDRPDPNMRYKIASHAAKYGPSGTLASKTPFNGPDEISSESTLRFENRASSATPQSTASSPRARPAALVLVTSWDDVLVQQDYDYLSARLSDFCICSDNAPRSSPSGLKGKMTHAEDCSILDDHLAFLQEQELPFRVAGRYQQSANNSFSPPAAGDLILQCSLVAGQAAIDGLNPDFENKPSSPTLQLQQKALKAMRRAITARNNVIDDSIVVASAIMLSVAAFYADQDAYRAHYSSLQRLIELRGGFHQTRAYGVVKALMASSEISLANHRYMAMTTGMPGFGVEKVTSPAQSPAQSPFKWKRLAPPFTAELTDIIEETSPGFRALAATAKLSTQMIQLLHSVCKWSIYIDCSPESDVDQERLFTNTTGSSTRLRRLYEESVQTKRMAALLLISLPPNTVPASLERCICLGFLNLLHSVTLQPHPVLLRDRLVIDFAEIIMSLNASDEGEEDCIIWLALAVASEWRHCAAKLTASPLPASHGYDTVPQSQMWLQKSKQIMDWLIVRRERCQTWEETASICSSFLWLPRLGTEWKQTWKEAMERRLRNIPRKRSRN